MYSIWQILFRLGFNSNKDVDIINGLLQTGFTLGDKVHFYVILILLILFCRLKTKYPKRLFDRV